METSERDAPGTLWAYAYQIVPSKAVDYLKEIESLLDEEHKHARVKARTWRGQLISEEQVTHILVVSDSPDQNTEVNHRIERRLKALNTRFSRTVPLLMPNGDTPPPGAAGPVAPRPPDVEGP